MLFYIHDFNNPTNLLRKEYSKVTYRGPVSQKVTYANAGFVDSFLYNLAPTIMAKPVDYSEQILSEIVETYKGEKTTANQPNIVLIMSESFSNQKKLPGWKLKRTRFQPTKPLLKKFSGQMLSQGDGGGTAKSEFEALTSWSMGALSEKLTTPTVN